jgi:hypothetical protein
MYIVTAENRHTGSLEYVSPALPVVQANELASALRQHTTLRVMIEQAAIFGEVAEKVLH